MILLTVALKSRLDAGLETSNFTLIEEAFLLNEDEETKKFKQDKYDKAHDAYIHRKESPEAKQKFQELNAEYEEVRKAIAGGANTMAELKVALKHNVKIVAEIDASMKEAEEKFTESGNGDKKKEYVLEAVEKECESLGIPFSLLKKLISALIDKIVANYNVIQK